MRLLLAGIVCSLLGCTSLESNPDPRATKSLPAIIQSSLVTPAEFVFQKVDADSWQVVSHDFSLKFDYIQCKRSGPRDLVIIFNILKDKRHRVSGWLADNLTTVGYDCVIINQEDFLSRKKLRPIMPDPELELADWDTYFSKNLQHLALIVNKWIPQQKELSGRYSFLGVSMGGILSVASAACFPDAQVSITVMAGGGNYQVLSESQESLVALNYRNLLVYYQQHFHLENEAAAKERLRIDLESLQLSILGIAECVPTNKIKQIISLYDTSVPTATQWNLHRALGGPETRLYPTGHISLGIFAWSVRDQIIRWLHEANP